MPVMDEFKEERAALKNGTLKEKISYFIYYYKWHVIITAAVAAMLISMIYQFVSQKEAAFYACFMNASALDYNAKNSELTQDFAEYSGIDTETYDIIYDTSIRIGIPGSDDYNSIQKFMVSIAAAEMDVVVTDTESIMKYAYQEHFQDLRDFLTPEQFEAYKDSFFYIDKAEVENIKAASEAYDYEYEPSYGDPKQPESMVDPIPVAVYLPKDTPLYQKIGFYRESVVASVLVNTKRPEEASQFLDYAMNR